MRARLLKVFMVILVLLPVGLTAYLANSLYHRKGVPEALENLTKQLFQSKEEERKAETRAKVLERKTEELQAAYDALVADLRGEVDSREIRVRQFREKLEINFVDKVLFASGSADITPKGRDILGRVGAVLGKVKGKSIYVVGHTDNMPIHSSLYPSNWELSAARAASVIRHLSEATGLSPERFTAMGRSFYQPVASNATPEGRQENRRVDIIVADVPLLAGETGSQSLRGTVSGGPEAAPGGDGEGQPLRQTAPAPHADGPDAAAPAKTEPAQPGSGATSPPPAVTPPAAGSSSAPATDSSSNETPAAPAVSPSPASPGAAATPEPTPDKAVAAPASPAMPEKAPASAPDTSSASPAAAPDAPGQSGTQAEPAPAGQDQPPAAPAEAAGKTSSAVQAPQSGRPASPDLPPPLPAAPAAPAGGS